MPGATDDAEALNRRGDTLQREGRLDDAIDCFRQAIRLRPDYFPAHNNLGNALQEKGWFEEALRSLKQAIVLRPTSALAWNNLGSLEQERGRLAEAARYFQRATLLAPTMAPAWNNLAGTALLSGRTHEAIDDFRRAVELDGDHPDAWHNLLLALHYPSDIADDAIASELASSARQRQVDPLPARAIDRTPDRRLRVGFLSGNFHRHPVGYFIGAAFSHLDRSQIDVVAYSASATGDDLTSALKAGVDTWADVAHDTDRQLAQRVAADRIDVLFELSGHARGGRLGALAYRPAPVQVALAGHFCSTGLSAVDYFVSDPIEAPEALESLYSETVWRLPATRVCYAPPDYAPPVSDLPAAVNGHVTFGCFNNPSKLSDNTFDLWARLMQALPSSRLVLKYRGADEPEMMGHLLGRMGARGIQPKRIACLGASPHLQMLKAYAAIDIALDPFPYGGGLTTCEALWMGVPVITLPQRRFCSRTSASHLHNAGLGDWIASSEDAYIGIAVEWAQAMERLSGLRAGLRERMRSSPLCNAAQYGQDLYAAIRAMWRIHCRAD